MLSVSSMSSRSKALSDGPEMAKHFYFYLMDKMGNRNTLLFHHWGRFSWVH